MGHDSQLNQGHKAGQSLISVEFLTGVTDRLTSLKLGICTRSSTDQMQDFGSSQQVIQHSRLIQYIPFSGDDDASAVPRVVARAHCAAGRSGWTAAAAHFAPLSRF